MSGAKSWAVKYRNIVTQETISGCVFAPTPGAARKAAQRSCTGGWTVETVEKMSFTVRRMSDDQ